MLAISVPKFSFWARSQRDRGPENIAGSFVYDSPVPLIPIVREADLSRLSGKCDALCPREMSWETSRKRSAAAKNPAFVLRRDEDDGKRRAHKRKPIEMTSHHILTFLGCIVPLRRMPSAPASSADPESGARMVMSSSQSPEAGKARVSRRNDESSHGRSSCASRDPFKINETPGVVSLFNRPLPCETRPFEAW